MSVNELRANRTGATVIFTKFTRMKDKFSNSIFCCFEGDDAKYYFKRIEDKTGYPPENIVVLNCSGKSEVLRLYHLIKEKDEYASINLLYFIDKDYDPPIEFGQNEIYETPVYSIENFYTTFEVFIRIIKCEFNYIETDDEYDILKRLFLERQKEFHEKTTILNAWLACQRDKSKQNDTSKLNISDFSLTKVIPNINLDEITSNYDVDSLERMFPLAATITEQELNNKISEFGTLNLQEIFRGKFEIDFLFAFLEAVKTEFTIPLSRLKKKNGMQLNPSKKNMISEFSQYASTTKCLMNYLSRFAAI